jgi:hypothetical protein
MALSKYELFHGAVLSQVIRNPVVNLKLFERSEKHGWGMYSVTDNAKTYLLYIKSTSKAKDGRNNIKYSNFTFSVTHIERLKEEPKTKNILLCLVCDSEEICLLDGEDLINLGLLEKNTSSTISVSWKKGSELNVKSGKRELSYKIKRSRLKNFAWQ